MLDRVVSDLEAGAIDYKIVKFGFAREIWRTLKGYISSPATQARYQRSPAA